MIETPYGIFPIPKDIKEGLLNMTDIELLEQYIEEYNKTKMISPFLFQEMKNRKLVFRGEYQNDIIKRLENLKQEGK